MIRLHLPLPPSLNELYPGNGKKRWKSKKYESWINLATTMLNEQWRGLCISSPIQITYRVGKPRNSDGNITRRCMDIANREKALSDFLVSHNVIKDDSLIHRLVMEWADIDGVDIEIVRY